MNKLHLPEVLEKRVDDMRLMAVRTHAKDVVSIIGSVLGGKNMLPAKKRAAAWLLEDLFDAGTKKHSRDELRDQLSKLGASLSFSVGRDRLFFTASCLPEDINTVLSILVECLTQATFPAAEVALSKKRILAELEEEKTDTNRQADIALDRALYDTKHPNYAISTAESVKSVKEVTRKEVVALYRKFGKKGLTVAIGGDIDPKEALAMVEKRCKLLPEGSFVATKMPKPERKKEQEMRVAIKDKANVDVMLGVRTMINLDSPQYLPFKVLLSLLGGSGISTGHLMRTVRERDGLTYGVRAYASGFSGGADGNMAIWATFAPSVVEKGLATIRKETKFFFKEGITSEALAMKKEEMIGKYLVSLSTTAGLVSTLHGNAIEGKEVSYLSEYPTLLEAVKLEEVLEARALAPLNQLSLVAAGTFES